MKGIKHSNLQTEMKVTKWQESVWKDIKSTFGILKSTKRFCKNQIELWNMKDIFNGTMMFLILHNILFLHHVMEDVNSRYDLLLAVVKDENA